MSRSAKEDVSKLLGHWKLVGIYNGVEQCCHVAYPPARTLYEFTATEFRHIINEDIYAYELRPEHDPAWIDLRCGSFVFRGIYLLDGDVLIMRSGCGTQPRPASFDAPAKVGNLNPTEIFVRHHRKKPFKRKPFVDMLGRG
jgi:uncharacterized protein (TIGR03067 family)